MKVTGYLCKTCFDGDGLLTNRRVYKVAKDSLMSHPELQRIIGTAIIDSGFRRRLLESSADVTDEFALTSTEREVLSSIHAGSLADFAKQLDAWIRDSGR